MNEGIWAVQMGRKMINMQECVNEGRTGKCKLVIVIALKHLFQVPEFRTFIIIYLCHLHNSVKAGTIFTNEGTKVWLD